MFPSFEGAIGYITGGHSCAYNLKLSKIKAGFESYFAKLLAKYDSKLLT